MKPCEIYELIEQTHREHQLGNMISHLCALAEVSRSGYYAWLDGEMDGQKSAAEDEADAALIKAIFEA